MTCEHPLWQGWPEVCALCGFNPQDLSTDPRIDIVCGHPFDDGDGGVMYVSRSDAQALLAALDEGP